jgi:hypothetical protein
MVGVEEERVLIGGTQPHEEKHFRRSHNNEEVDRWIPHEVWATASKSFLKSGIMIQIKEEKRTDQ